MRAPWLVVASLVLAGTARAEDADLAERVRALRATRLASIVEEEGVIRKLCMSLETRDRAVVTLAEERAAVLEKLAGPADVGLLDRLDEIQRATSEAEAGSRKRTRLILSAEQAARYAVIEDALEADVRALRQPAPAPPATPPAPSTDPTSLLEEILGELEAGAKSPDPAELAPRFVLAQEFAYCLLSSPPEGLEPGLATEKRLAKLDAVRAGAFEERSLALKEGDERLRSMLRALLLRKRPGEVAEHYAALLEVAAPSAKLPFKSRPDADEQARIDGRWIEQRRSWIPLVRLGKRIVAAADAAMLATAEALEEALRRTDDDPNTGERDTRERIDALLVSMSEEGIARISVGRDDKVVKGMTFVVYRGAEYLGRVLVEVVKPDMSTCRVTYLKEGASLQTADRVTHVLE